MTTGASGRVHDADGGDDDGDLGAVGASAEFVRGSQPAAPSPSMRPLPSYRVTDL